MARLPKQLFDELASLVELEDGTFQGLAEIQGFLGDVDEDLVALESPRNDTAVGFSQGRLRALVKRGLIEWDYDVRITDKGRALIEAAGGHNAPAPVRSDVAEALDHIDLHPAIDRRVRRAFDDNDPQGAVADAFIAIEVQLRAALGHQGHPASPKSAGGLITEILSPGGALADPARPHAEQVGVMQLFQGAIAAVRNPNAHGKPTYAPAEALRLILFADHLLRAIPGAPE